MSGKRKEGVEERNEKIIALRMTGMTHAAIGERFGLAETTVHEIVSNAGLRSHPQRGTAKPNYWDVHPDELRQRNWRRSTEAARAILDGGDDA